MAVGVTGVFVGDGVTGVGDGVTGVFVGVGDGVTGVFVGDGVIGVFVGVGGEVGIVHVPMHTVREVAQSSLSTVTPPIP